MALPNILTNPSIYLVAMGVLGMSAVGGPARADEEEQRFPRFEAEIDIEIQDDWTFDSDDPDTELNDLFTTTEPALALHLLPGLSIQSGLVLEPVADPDPGDDRAFEDHGFFAEQLYLLYEHEAFSVYGGKFNLPFGVGWDLAPGVYGTDVAEAFYEQVERIGVGGALAFGGEGIGGEGFGQHGLSVQTYFADTTFLSESALKNRGRTRKSDGGVSNTEDFSSVAVSLDGGGITDAPLDLNYHLAVMYQARGEGDPEDELGFAAALHGGIELGDDLTLEPILEYIHFDNAGGARLDRDIFTAGFGLGHGPWNAAFSYSGVFTDPDDPADDLDVTQFQVSAGYSFDFGLDFDLGYKFVEEEGINSHVFGGVLHYVIDFSIPD